jgi:glycine betaine catabolism A
MAVVEVHPAREDAELADALFAPEELEGTLRPLAEATSLPARAYTDPHVFAFERDRWWGSDWVCVGRASDVAEAGRWFVAEVGPGRVLVLGGEDGVPRAFHNVCRHRGVTLMEGRGERATCIRCPYHAWTYDLRGQLVRTPVPGETDALAPFEKDLRPVRLEVFGGFLFVSLEPIGPSLLDWLNDLPAQFEGIPLETLVLGRRTETLVQANWKLLMENFAEAYHFGPVHPQLQRVTPSHRAESLLSIGPWQGGWMPLRPGAETVSKDGKRHGRPLLRKAGPELAGALDYVLFPNLFLSLHPDYLLAYRLAPVSHERTRVTFDVLFDRRAAEDGVVAAPDVYEFWQVTNAQDFAICERQQTGIGTPGFVPGRYMAAEEGVHEFDKIVAQRLLEG